MTPLLAVTSGEPAGVGPELCLRLIECPFDGARLVILADRQLLAERARALNFTGQLRDWTPGAAAVPGVSTSSRDRASVGCASCSTR